MLTLLPSPPDVISLRIEGSLDHDEVERIIDLVETSLGTNQKTHMFVELVDFEGLDLGKLPYYTRRALSLLAKLDRFGRIAVVSDQAWLRALAKIESALLPHVSYETFVSAERDRALAWVEGRSPSPHGPSVKVIETSSPDVLGFEIDGKLTRMEVEAVARYFGEKLDRFERVRIVGRVKRLGGVELGGLLDSDFIKMKLRAFSRVERYALVGGPDWLVAWASTLDAIVKAEIRHFDASEEAGAWAWVGAKPRSEHVLLPAQGQEPALPRP